MSIKLEHDGVTSTVQMDLPPMNLLNISVIDELVALHQEADAHPQTRVIVTASAVSAMFSNGLNPMFVLKQSPEQRVETFKAVGRLLHGLAGLGKPHVMALNGPAMAGGAVLAITGDFRIMDAHHGRLCFSEPKIGLPIPFAVQKAVSLYCKPAMMREVVFFGKNMDAHTALEFGLVDVLAESPADFEHHLEHYISRIARLSPAVLKATKAAFKQDLLAASANFAENLGPDFNRFVGDEFLGEGLQALVENRKPVFKV